MFLLWHGLLGPPQAATPVITVASLRETHYQLDSILCEGVELMVVVAVGVKIGLKVADCQMERNGGRRVVWPPLRFDENGVSLRLPDSFFVMRVRFQSHCKKNQALGKPSVPPHTLTHSEIRKTSLETYLDFEFHLAQGFPSPDIKAHDTNQFGRLLRRRIFPYAVKN